MENTLRSGSTVKILFVDDEENILRSLTRLFLDEDLEVITASSGEDALEVLRENMDIGIIISDQRMPGLTGVDFLEKSREIVPDAVRIILTGYADVKAAIGAINRGGAYRYITKPWEDEELIQVIKDALQRYSLIVENRRLNGLVKKQNEELKRWNAQLEHFVQEQTIEIQKKNDELEKLNRRLKSNFKSTIMSFSGLLELRDRRTKHHSKHVADLSIKVARSLGFSHHELEMIMVASLLHDIGKIGIPDNMLSKEMEKMNDKELKEYMLHPVRSQTVIDSIEYLREAGRIIRHHHEWYNGNGFPDGLKGEEIPLSSRILALSDFVDLSARKIQDGDPVERILSEVKNESGKRFDPNLYEHIVAPLKEKFGEIVGDEEVVELEVSVKKLEEGMIVSRDVLSGTGILLLSKGVELKRKHIDILKRYFELDPSKSGIYVWERRG